MIFSVIWCVLSLAIETKADTYEYNEYYGESIEDLTVDDRSTPSPPLFTEGGLDDVRIDKIPICIDDPDNIDCGTVHLNINDLKNKEKIHIPGIGSLFLDYKTEYNGIHSLIYSGEGDITAYFTYFQGIIIGVIHLEDGKVKKIMSISKQKQIMSLIDVPHSIKTEDDEDKEARDSLGDAKLNNLDRRERQLVLNGEVDADSIAKVSVTVYYNADAEKQMMAVPPEVYIQSKIIEVNHGYRKSNVPIKIVLHAFQKTQTDFVSDIGISNACDKGITKLRNLAYGEMMDETEKDKRCQRQMVGQFRKLKGSTGKPTEQAKLVKMGANMAVLLVNKIPGREDFCGRASNHYDIGRQRGKMNLAVVSIAGGCDYTFGHELGHLFGLFHQKDGNEDKNKYFSYGHGYRISRKHGDEEGTRTVMATASGMHQKRLNVYSNPKLGTGTPETADNSRVLRETRYLAAYTDNAKMNDLKYHVHIERHSCHASDRSLPLGSCPDKMRPKTFIEKLCGNGLVCCAISPGCIRKFPEVEQTPESWFMLRNRQNNKTLSIASLKSHRSYASSVGDLEEGNLKQIWKWEGQLLVSKWNQAYVLDCSVRPCVFAKRTGKKHQNFRFSDGFLVDLGQCAALTVSKGMSIARKWYMVEVESQENTIKNVKTNYKVSFNTHLCKQDETCTEIDHCYEVVSPKRMRTKFCDNGRVCCKTKVCHDVEHLEATEIPVKGWFALESQMNKKILTVKSSKAKQQEVVNSRTRQDMQGQVWKWKENYIISHMGSNLVLDGSFGKVSIKDKKQGNIYQKWRKSGGLLVNAGHCEVLDVAYANKKNDALVTIWSVHGHYNQKWTTRPVSKIQGQWKFQ